QQLRSHYRLRPGVRRSLVEVRRVERPALLPGRLRRPVVPLRRADRLALVVRGAVVSRPCPDPANALARSAFGAGLDAGPGAVVCPAAVAADALRDDHLSRGGAGQRPGFGREPAGGPGRRPGALGTEPADRLRPRRLAAGIGPDARIAQPVRPGPRR